MIHSISSQRIDAPRENVAANQPKVHAGLVLSILASTSLFIAGIIVSSVLKMPALALLSVFALLSLGIAILYFSHHITTSVLQGHTQNNNLNNIQR